VPGSSQGLAANSRVRPPIVKRRSVGHGDDMKHNEKSAKQSAGNLSECHFHFHVLYATRQSYNRNLENLSGFALQNVESSAQLIYIRAS
jgi:hypothetical protein